VQRFRSSDACRSRHQYCSSLESFSAIFLAESAKYFLINNVALKRFPELETFRRFQRRLFYDGCGITKRLRFNAIQFVTSGDLMTLQSAR
jgi:hypothetical protein